MRNHIDLCYHAAYENAGARWNMREIILPMLRTRLAELRQCRAECQANPRWAEDWDDAGMVRDEEELAGAIGHAEARLRAEQAVQLESDLRGALSAVADQCGKAEAIRIAQDWARTKIEGGAQ